jgi:hypothetical protein
VDDVASIVWQAVPGDRSPPPPRSSARSSRCTGTLPTRRAVCTMSVDDMVSFVSFTRQLCARVHVEARLVASSRCQLGYNSRVLSCDESSGFTCKTTALAAGSGGWMTIEGGHRDERTSPASTLKSSFADVSKYGMEPLPHVGPRASSAKSVPWDSAHLVIVH